MGLDVDADATTTEVRRAAILACQLPRDSRTKGAWAPASAHSLEADLLREIEHNQRLWHWANTKDAKRKETAPERMQLPGEEEAHERAVEHAEARALSTAERLGIKL